MELRKLYEPSKGPLQVAGLMSGGGTNLCKLIELERKLDFLLVDKSPYDVAVIFSDDPGSNAVSIGDKYGIPVVVHDIREFYVKKGAPIRDMSVRAEFDAWTVEALSDYHVGAAAYAGYMRIATKPLVDAFVGVNVHPADLSVLDKGGRRKFTGDAAVRDAIVSGERFISSTTHLVEEGVDEGRILLVSPPVEVDLGGVDAEYLCSGKDPVLLKRIASENQDRLKTEGDWMIFPYTMLFLSQGRFAEDEDGHLFFDRRPIPRGLRLSKDD
jgi:phosphoribosylglycinamide formyltransferase-1